MNGQNELLVQVKMVLLVVLHDIIQDNIRLTRDTAGEKGFLIERAGSPDLSIDVSSDLALKIIDYETRVGDLLESMANQEEAYYLKFARMESALTSLYAQSDWMASQF